MTSLAKKDFLDDPLDNVELAAEKGIRQIVQPGGSIKDKQVIAACDALDVSMVFTGLRHFKH